jgi:hypothetical protein
VFNDPVTMENEIIKVGEECVKEFKIPIKMEYKKLTVIDGYSAEGYKKILPQKLK